MCFELNYILMSLLFIPLFQEVELWEACHYGLVGQVHHFLTTGVNVNVTQFVSTLPNNRFFPGSHCCVSTIVHSWCDICHYVIDNIL